MRRNLIQGRMFFGLDLVHDLIPLTQVTSGATGQVAQLIGTPDDVHRLEEMGLSDGACVEIVQSGTPCIVRIDGKRFCFRDGEALGILVRVGAAG